MTKFKLKIENIYLQIFNLHFLGLVKFWIELNLGLYFGTLDNVS